MPVPNLFVVGTMKAGTTTLYSWLNSHPLIYMPPVKEPNYFSSDLWQISTHIVLGTESLIEQATRTPMHNALICEEKLYLKLFPQNAECYRYLGDASPSYLRSQVAAEKIFNWAPDAKIIILLRDPIERAWSHFIMERNEARVPEDFAEMMDDELRAMERCEPTQHGILESGLYYKCLSRYFERFEASNILIADQSELREHAIFFEKLNKFLLFEENMFSAPREVANHSVGPRFPWLNRVLAESGVKQLVRYVFPKTIVNCSKRMYYREALSSENIDDRVRAELIRFYRDDVCRLVSLLGDDAPSWATRYV